METPRLRVAQPGLLTTLQDQGRVGHQQTGMPVAGAMDLVAAQCANLLVGNPRGEAVLEITLRGPTLDVLSEAVLAACGADLSARLDGVPVPLWKTVGVRTGQRLEFGRRRSGARAYLALGGGFAVTPVLGSRSTYLRADLGGYEGHALRVGDVLAGGQSRPAGPRRGLADVPTYDGPVRVVLGPHEDRFTPGGLQTFLSGVYTLTPQSDRMGCRFDGPIVAHTGGADILSEPAAFGAVQVPPDGRPIVLMADRQTIGGYTQVATVVSVDLPKIAQLAPGDAVTFQPVSVEDAQALAVTQEKWLRLLEGATRG